MPRLNRVVFSVFLGRQAGTGQHGIVCTGFPIVSATDVALSSLPENGTRCSVALLCFKHAWASSFRKFEFDDLNLITYEKSQAGRELSH